MSRKKKKAKSVEIKKGGWIKYVIIGLFIALFIYSAYSLNKRNNSENPSETLIGIELPAPLKGEQIITHEGYTLSYNEENEQANWVAYTLTKDMLFGENTRKDNFRPDPAVSTGSAELSDYKGSGYDRGHLIPAADVKYSAAAMDDSFFLSNMTPQNAGFNRGIWASLEAVVRTFAYDNGTIYVVTGPVLTDGPYDTIGANSVSVPKYFYKVILDYNEPELKAIGFILANEDSSKPLSAFAVSVDDVEKITGIDFYPMLPDDVESELESSYDVGLWNFTEFNSSAVDYVPGEVKTNQRRTSDVKAVLNEMERIIKSAVDSVIKKLK